MDKTQSSFLKQFTFFVACKRLSMTPQHWNKAQQQNMSNLLLTFDFKAYSRKDEEGRHVRVTIEEAINYATATNLIRPFCLFCTLLLATKKGEKRPEGDEGANDCVSGRFQ